MSNSSNNSSSNFVVRGAVPEDWRAIAGLHLRSWRSAYRGILSDAYLDAEAEEDRLRTWKARIGDGRAEGIGTFVAEREGEIVGFVSVDLGAERTAQWGPRVENLHSRPDCRGQGIGRVLLQRGARWVEERAPGSAIHLYVFEKNRSARGFYRHLGGQEVERILVHTPDGGDLPELVCWWESARRLAGSANE
jgi:ribosomal protein S18 acetylase RimI-like enzyme